MTSFKSQMIFSRLPTCATLRGMGEQGKDLGIILRLGPRSENTVELLRLNKKIKMVQPIIRGGGSL